MEDILRVMYCGWGRSALHIQLSPGAHQPSVLSLLTQSAPARKTFRSGPLRCHIVQLMDSGKWSCACRMGCIECHKQREWHSPGFLQLLVWAPVYASVCVCEGSKNKERQQEMGVHVVVYACREEPPIRLTAGGLSPGKKTPRFLALRTSDCRPEALVHSMFCIIAPRVTCRRARPTDRSASQVLPRVFPPELRGLLRRQRGQRCVCLSRSDCSPGLQGKPKSTDTHWHVSFIWAAFLRPNHASCNSGLCA